MGKGREGRPEWYKGMETFGRGGGTVRRPCHNEPGMGSAGSKGTETFGRPGGTVRRPCHNEATLLQFLQDIGG